MAVWTAENVRERNRGLSGIEKLEEVDGMLFIFQKEEIPSFWMKEMNFPIDIIWINSTKEIIEVMTNITPETYPKTFSPKNLIQYVLEVDAGWSEEKSIKIGDKLVL